MWLQRFSGNLIGISLLETASLWVVMKIILLGAPGSGRTQAQKLHELLNYEVITASSVPCLSKSGCDLGKRIRSDMDAGILVSDDIVWQVIKKDISEQSTKHQKIISTAFLVH